MRNIKTFGEAIKLHGKRVSCKIEGTEIKDAKIYVKSSRRIFICQNVRNGMDSPNKLGYKYSFVVDGQSEFSAGISDMKLISKYIEFDESKCPEWYDGRPMVMQVSDTSEENAKSKDWYAVGIFTHESSDYPFLELEGTRRSKPEDCNISNWNGDTTGWKYAVPYEIPDTESMDITITVNGKEISIEKFKDILSSIE